MRRLGALAALGIFLLSGCRISGGLESDEVLRRATTASAQLESAALQGEGEFALTTPALTLQTQAQYTGALAHGGRETALSVALEGTIATAAIPSSAFQARADLVREPDIAYLFLHSLSLNPAPAQLAGLQSMTGGWWKIPARQPGLTPAAVTPDPEFLRAQAAVVTVTEDMGIQRIAERDAYRYRVSIDPARLLALLQTAAQQQGKAFDAVTARADLERYDAHGELWIDAETFVIHRLAWTILSKEKSAAGTPTMRLVFQLNLSGHNKGSSVTIPTDARVYSGASFLQLLFTP